MILSSYFIGNIKQLRSRKQIPKTFPNLAIIVLLCAILGNANAKPKSTLLIVDKSTSVTNIKQSHSNFLNLVQELGHTLTVKSADDSTLKLSKYGEFLYDNLLILSPQVDVFRGSISVKDLLEFIDAGHNVLLVGGHQPGSVISELAAEVGFEFKESATQRDYANTKLNDIFYVVGDKSTYTSTAFSYSGTQLKLVKSDLTLEILSNNAPVDDIRPSSTNKYLTNVLIGAMQARNNARVLVSGSLDFFSDKAFETSKSANKQLTNELLKWLLKEKSLLRYSQISHSKINNDEVASTDLAAKTDFEGYTIMDDIEYRIKIELYEDGQWKPYTSNDVQLEFVRIDPFIRQTMQHQSDGTYLARFKIPDVYGVFKFQVDYKRDGLTYLFSSTQVSVRPLRHDEYERFIYSAYPYYLSAFLMMIYLYVFSFVYLYQQREKRNSK